MIDRLLARRDRLPRVVNRMIDHVADHPMGLAGRIAARRLGKPAGQDATPVSRVEPALRRVLIAPVNYSGQARAWARALERVDPELRAVNMAVDVPGGFSFPADLVVSVPVYNNGRRWQDAQLAAVTSGFTHVLIEAEEPLFGRRFGRDAAAEQRVLTEAGVDVAFMAHGTDVRLPSGHRERTPWSRYRDEDFYTDRLERLAVRNRRIVEESGRPAFVSTPDLVDDLPTARWCPVVVDLDHWRAPDIAEHGGALRVVHSPTNPRLKGTDRVEPILAELEARGVVRYSRIEGVPWARMPEAFAQADVVLDQFRLGSYGVAACEAMAAGRVVIGHVTPEVRARVQRDSGRALPIVEATPDTIGEVLERLAGDRGELIRIAREGREFVRVVHDGRMSARVLREEWLSPGAEEGK